MSKMMYKFGKKPARIDERTIKLKTILRTGLPPVPSYYEIDEHLPVPVPTPMFANDQKGDCVMATRGHQTLRFECMEQGQCIPITDEEILEEYYLEGCFLHRWFSWLKIDRGLVMLDSLNEWRNSGWNVGHRVYDIYAYAALDPFDHYDLQASIFFLGGAQGGIRVPQSAVDQFSANQIWDDIGDRSNLGGHAIPLIAYNQLGPKCITWSRVQQMTWKFWDTYTDESYAVIDNRDSWMENSPIDVTKLNSILDEITK